MGAAIGPSSPSVQVLLGCCALAGGQQYFVLDQHAHISTPVKKKKKILAGFDCWLYAPAPFLSCSCFVCTLLDLRTNRKVYASQTCCERIRIRSICCLGRDTRLLSETKARRARGDVVDDVLALKEDVAEDVEADFVVGLDAAEAGAGASPDRRVVDVLAGHGLGNAADGDGEVGQSRRARENVAALGAVVLCTADLGIVGLHNGSVKVDQGCAGIDNGVDAGPDSCGGANRVAARGEAPETLAVVDVDIGDGTGVLLGVDEAEVVGTSGVVLQIDSEEGLRKRGLDGVEPRVLADGRDGVDRAESKTEETVSVTVLGELSRDGGSSLDSLGGGSHASNGDFVGIDLARCTGVVAVADLPGVAALELGGIDLVVVMARELS